MVPRCIAGLACLTILLGTGIAQEKDKSPDEQVKDLIVKYRALPEKDQIGPQGASIIQQLKAVPGQLAPRSREAFARLETAHNLRQLALAIQPYEGKDAKPPSVGPKWPPQLLPSIEPGLARPRWQYKVVPEADVLKLGKGDLAAGLNQLGESGWELVAFEKTRFIPKRQNAVPFPAP
jgi:hypothetical protein